LHPDNASENISITSNKVGEEYYYNQSYGQVGFHYYHFWAEDQNNNSVNSSTYFFYIGDSTAPVISNIQRATSVILDTDPMFGWVNITCDVVDNNNVSLVYLNITNPDNSTSYSEMGLIGSDSYCVNSSTAFSVAGNYTYYVWSVDDDSNMAISISYGFSMPPNYDVNVDGMINLLDLVFVTNYFNEPGQPGWIREDVDNNGLIQVLDLVMISNHYEETWWL
jgi:hypothetical protein